MVRPWHGLAGPCPAAFVPLARVSVKARDALSSARPEPVIWRLVRYRYCGQATALVTTYLALNNAAVNVLRLSMPNPVRTVRPDRAVRQWESIGSQVGSCVLRSRYQSRTILLLSGLTLGRAISGSWDERRCVALRGARRMKDTSGDGESRARTSGGDDTRDPDRAPLLVEVISEGPHCVPCEYAIAAVEYVAESYQGRIGVSVVEVKQREGAFRYLELTRTNDRRIPMPAVLINGRVAFEGIPEPGELSDALDRVLKEREADS